MNTNIQIEVVTRYNHIQVKKQTPLYDAEGNIVDYENHRQVVTCGDWDKAAELNLTQTAEIFWTQDVLDDYEAFKQEQEVANA